MATVVVNQPTSELWACDVTTEVGLGLRDHISSAGGGGGEGVARLMY